MHKQIDLGPIDLVDTFSKLFSTKRIDSKHRISFIAPSNSFPNFMGCVRQQKSFMHQRLTGYTAANLLLCNFWGTILKFRLPGGLTVEIGNAGKCIKKLSWH